MNSRIRSLSLGIPAHLTTRETQDYSQRARIDGLSIALADHPRVGGGVFTRASWILSTTGSAVYIYALNVCLRNPSVLYSEIAELHTLFGDRFRIFLGMGSIAEWREDSLTWEKLPERVSRLRRLSLSIEGILSRFPGIDIGVAGNSFEIARIAVDFDIAWGVRHSMRDYDLNERINKYAQSVSCVSVMVRSLVITQEQEKARLIVSKLLGIPQSRVIPPFFLIGEPAVIVSGLEETLKSHTIHIVAGEARNDIARLAILRNWMMSRCEEVAK